MSSDYCELPVSLRRKHSVVNIRNKDNFSVLYCIAAGLRRIKPKRYRTSTSHYDICKLRYDGVVFPTDISSIPQLEDLNKVMINIFTYDAEINSLKAVYKSDKSAYRSKINLLLLQNMLGSSHYAYISNISCFMKSKICEFICRSCCQMFRTNELYQAHLSSCSAQIVIPKKLKIRTGLRSINCKDLDDNMLELCITGALYPVYDKQGRFCPKASCYTEMRESLRFPDTRNKSLDDAVYIIGDACEININIFLYQYVNHSITPYIIPKTSHDKFADLLLVRRGNQETFMIIKDLSSIYWQRTKAKHWVCRRCLQICLSPEKLSDHEELCKNFKAQKVQLSDQKELRFKNIRKQYCELFTVFAGK